MSQYTYQIPVRKFVIAIPISLLAITIPLMYYFTELTNYDNTTISILMGFILGAYGLGAMISVGLLKEIKNDKES